MSSIYQMHRQIEAELAWPKTECLPVVIRKDYWSNEYRVAYRLEYISLHERGMGYKDKLERIEATAYYTDDEDDAIGTALHMIKQGYQSK